MDGCFRRVSNTTQAVWTNLTHATDEFKKIAYKVSNYLLGGTFRNILFAPPQLPPSTLTSCENFFQEPNKVSRREVLKNFTYRTQEIAVSMNNIQFFLQVHIYETHGEYTKIHTCLRIGGRDETLETSDLRVYPLLKAYVKAKDGAEQAGLRIIQFSLHGHCNGSTKQPWEPKDSSEIGNLFFAFLQKMQESYVIDSLICHSLGSIVMESLDHKKHKLPPIVILDRSFTSVWKVGCRFYNPVVAYVLYAGALLSGWAIAPEIFLKKYFQEQRQELSLSNRKVILIEVKNDHYFAGKGAFDDSFTQELNRMGIGTFRKSFEPNNIAFHERSHHCLALNKLKNGKAIDNNPIMPLQAYESAAFGLMKFLLCETRKPR